MAQTRIIQSIPEGDTITVNCQFFKKGTHTYE